MGDVYHVKNEGYLLDVFYDEFFNRNLSIYFEWAECFICLFKGVNCRVEKEIFGQRFTALNFHVKIIKMKCQVVKKICFDKIKHFTFGIDISEMDNSGKDCTAFCNEPYKLNIYNCSTDLFGR